MPIYEFLCTPCHTIFNFFSSKIDTQTDAACPRCSESLARKPASFATLKHPGETTADPFSGLDGPAIDSAMRELARDFDTGEENPQQMAQLLRKFGETSGMEMGARMEELVASLEEGADPESLDSELGENIDDKDALVELFRVRRTAAEEIQRPPAFDEELYFL